jgi:hypothetical protein
MPSIDSIGMPLVFKAEETGDVPESGPGRIAIRAEVRALEGMQKEAIVHHGPTGTRWRMVSDEGPYLNGTDLAPFPLAFYTAGTAFSFMTEFFRHARAHNVETRSIKLIQDSYYTMQGSAIRGDMLCGARPAEMKVEVNADASDEMVNRLVQLAEKSSPAQSYMRDVLQNTFSLHFNGQPIDVADVAEYDGERSPDPTTAFERLRSLDESEYQPDIILKQDLHSYRIIQDNVFQLSGRAEEENLLATAEPVNTQVFVEMNESAEAARKLVSMSERTCFLHAAMRSSNPAEIKTRASGE